MDRNKDPRMVQLKKKKNKNKHKKERKPIKLHNTVARLWYHFGSSYMIDLSILEVDVVKFYLTLTRSFRSLNQTPS